MNDACLKTTKKCFDASRIRYADLKKRFEASNAFNYDKYKTDFFNSQRIGLQRLLASVHQWENNGAFIKEVKKNSSDEVYFDRFNHILSVQFDFISKFNDALDLYFNHGVDAGKLFDTLQFFENHSFDPMVGSSSRWLDNDQSPATILSKQLNRQEFVRAMQIYHISAFETIEKVYLTYVPDYQQKLLARDYINNGGDIETHISLKYGIRNAEIISEIFKVLSRVNCIDCSYEEFATVFYPGNNQIQWLGTQKQLMLMFKGSADKSLTTNNAYIEPALVRRFKNKSKFKPFKVEQLRVEHNGFLTGENVKRSSEILAFLDRLSN